MEVQTINAPRQSAPPATQTPRLFVSRKQAAEILCVCVRTVDSLIAEGRLPIRRVRRRVLIPFAAIEEIAVPEKRGRAARVR